MLSTILTIVLSFLGDILKDVIKDQINKPKYTVKGNFTGQISSEDLHAVYNPNDYLAKYDRMLSNKN